MDTEVARYAHIGLETYEEYVGGSYVENREILNRKLGDLAVEDFDEAKQNLTFLSEFVKLLPRQAYEKTGEDRYHWGGSYFETEEQAEARALQASAVWIHRPRIYHMQAFNERCYPYYIVGKTIRSGMGHLLLHAAASDEEGDIPWPAMDAPVRYDTQPSPLLKAKVPVTDIEAFEARVKLPFSAADLTSVRSSKTGKFTIVANSPGSTADSYDGFLNVRTPRRAGKRNDRSIMKLIDKEWLAVLTPIQLLEYKVFDQLNHLAMAHKVADRAKILLEAKALERPSTKPEE